MKTLFQNKRDSLETFIREQMIGPNGCKGRFGFMHEDSKTESKNARDVFDDKVDEIINTTPGSIYSTAILFPKKDESTQDEQTTKENGDEISVDTSIITDAKVATNEEGEDDELSRSDSNEQTGDLGGDADDEDVYSLNRRFPNAIGLSCCLDPDADLNNSVKITLSGRFYSKVSGADMQKVYIPIVENRSEFEQFYQTYPSLHSFFPYTNGQLRVNNIGKGYSTIKGILRDINKKCAEVIANMGGFTDPLYSSINPNYAFLQSYREKLFNESLNRITRQNSYLTPRQKQDVINRINEIEKYETFMSYFDDLMGLYDHTGYGFWRSHSFEEQLDLSSIDFSRNTKSTKVVYKPSDYPCLDKVFKVVIDGKTIALSVWLQITRNSKNLDDKNLYLKVLLVNDSDSFCENKKHYFSIVNEEVNKLSFFGVKLDIESEYIRPYQADRTYSDIGKEEDKLNFLYRSVKDYGVGHYCSVDWPRNGEVKHIWSEFIPTYETPDIEPVPRRKYSEYITEKDALVPAPYLTDNQCLQFKWLSIFSDATDREIIDELKKFVGFYKDWIEEEKKHITIGKEEQFAEENLHRCEEDMQRMLSNIQDILEQNKENILCFRLMNAAMFMQLWHNKSANQNIISTQHPTLEEKFYKEVNDEIFASGQHASWRPFQLAFILLNLDGIIQNPNDEGWKKRNELVDLVWFPTGGGKTEAYLGIIALSIIYRRRTHGAQGGGVTAIMRYTLRLLTTQQFQRALRLILALEQIRKWNQYNLGETAISIGLYVGNSSLPNSVKDLDDEALRWNRRSADSNTTKIPLDRCPWCGGLLQYSANTHTFACSNTSCTFDEKLPVRLCDEHIYEEPPTLLFGTVDKFAIIAHKVSTTKSSADSKRIFGCGIDCLPPDLIIQDELHLLLGPLGSAVSLFECAVDQLCTREEDGTRTRPKIISSTATTRNTNLQIRALYDRDVNIFPHNGVDYDDSFFAFYKRKKENGVVQYVSKRKYMGIMPTGRTQMTTQMRLAAILLVHRAIFEKDHIKDPDFESVADNYFSVISYFNSLKEVGKTDAMFYTEYTKYVRRLFKRVMRYGDLLECFYTMKDLQKKELTGRLSGSEVNEAFAKVSQQWTLNDRLPHQDKNGQWVWGVTPPDYILATNMISVGLDVSRFNTIIMNSMPRNIAEYIQASSRVARQQIGLVIALHNPFRSRDVSHFEKFREFHEKLYFYVEPISITPFSQKSIDKYLPLYLAAVIRHSFNSLAGNNNAAAINNKLEQQITKMVGDYFNNRYTRTNKLSDPLEKGLLTQELKDYILKFVEDALAEWDKMAGVHHNNLVYNSYGRNQNPALFTSPSDYEEVKNDSAWVVPQSLRIVEPEAVLHITVK